MLLPSKDLLPESGFFDLVIPADLLLSMVFERDPLLALCFLLRRLVPELRFELPKMEEGGGCPAGVNELVDEGGGPAGVVEG